MAEVAAGAATMTEAVRVVQGVAEALADARIASELNGGATLTRRGLPSWFFST
ncbi:Uncharacterised protein [Paucimonas lemoignei]|nr:Uncharacterised protein [Paucimonas lemoignei]